MLVRVLGPAADADHGLRPMERRLLTALAVCRPEPATLGSLIDALWPGVPPASARKTVQNNVLRVRRRLGPGAIETVGAGYRLGDGVRTDLQAFEEALVSGPSSQDPAGWDEVLDWCPARPLEDLRHWPPADARRSQLEELRSSAVEARWAAALARPGGADHVPDLEALVADAPLRESRWRLLIAAYQRAGRPAEGLRAFERARRTLAVEIGATPGPELVGAYEALLRDEPVLSPLDHASTPAIDMVLASDERRAAAAAALAGGETAEALNLFAEAALLARIGGDLRRFAEAALSASGDGWRTGFDATAEAATLLTTALAMVPPAPTPLRARLLARAAVVGSHHRTAASCEAQARTALATARAVHDTPAVVAALHALAVVVWDPQRWEERLAWVDELTALAEASPAQPWRRWAAPVAARTLAIGGDIAGAAATLDRLAAEAETCGDTGATYAASQVDVLRSTVAGDWPAAACAIERVCDTARAAGFDPAGVAMQRLGLRGVISLLAGPTDVEPLAPIEWPLPSFDLTVAAWHANCQARAGHIDAAAAALARIDPATVTGVERNGYWMATLSMLADGAHLTGTRTIGEAVAACLVPLSDLTIVDPGLIYRGSAAHAAGLAAIAAGRRGQALDLLEQGLAEHRRHGSPWMAARSRQALASIR